MKKILFFTFSISTSIFFGQVSYLSSDFANVGDSQFVSSTINNADYDFVQTGANFNWNYSGLIPINQESVSFINPNNTGYKERYCLFNFVPPGFLCNTLFNNNFNLATQFLGSIDLGGISFGNAYMHMRKTTGNVQNRMIGIEIPLGDNTEKIIINYSQPDTLYEFPFTFGSTSTSNSVSGLNLSPLFPFSFTIAQERINTVEGWGSLITPFGTFNQVLKMKTVLNTTTSINNDGQIFEVPTITHQYKWFDKAHGIPVLEVSGLVTNGVWTANSIRYIDNELNSNAPTLDQVVIYPNPTNGELFINLEGKKVKSISVVNLLGQEVGQSLDLSHLNAGLYLVNVETDMGNISKKIFKQ
jgi:hypothetical protein